MLFGLTENYGHLLGNDLKTNSSAIMRVAEPNFGTQNILQERAARRSVTYYAFHLAVRQLDPCFQ